MSRRMRDVIAGVHGELRHEPVEARLRATLGPDAVVDSTRAMLLWEPRRVVPGYAGPADDVAGELTPAPAADEHVDGVLHPRIPFRVHTAPGEPVTVAGREGAGFRLEDPDLPGYVALDFGAFDAWYEEDERVLVHPREPFHRVDARRSSRRVRIELGGELLADTTRARLVAETRLPLRFYLPREDVRVPLHPSPTRTRCPYKGEASYWSADVGARRHADLAWTCPTPLPALAEIAGLVAFWDERVDVVLDGERRPRPRGPIADALRYEFGL